MNEMLASLLPEGVNIIPWPHPGVLPRPDWLWGLIALNMVTRSCGIANWAENLYGDWLTNPKPTDSILFVRKRLGGKSAAHRLSSMSTEGLIKLVYEMAIVHADHLQV